MEFLRNIWRRLNPEPAAKTTVFPDDDEIYPVHALDSIKTNRHYLYRLMQFNDVLDPDKLHSGLQALLNTGDWRKLGGRLRSSGNLLVLSVPRTFTPKRPPVTYSHDNLSEIKILDHALGKRLPRPTQNTTFFPISGEFSAFATSPGLPSTFEEHLNHDVPQLSLRITSFRDATVVGLIYPHTMMDASGHRVFLRAWSSAVGGQFEEIPTVSGAKNDVIKTFANAESSKGGEELVMEDARLKGLDLVLFVVRFIWDCVWYPANDTRLFRISKEELESLKTQAKEEARLASSKLPEDCFVSEADILTAWISRSVARSEQASRPLTMASLVNMRFRLSLRQPGSVYLQNMIFVAYTALTRLHAQGSIGSLALAHRQALAEQTSQAQAMTWLQTLYGSSQNGKDPQLFFGNRNAVMVIINNLLKLDIYRAVDFDSAVIRVGDADSSRSNPPGAMINSYTFPLHKSRFFPRSGWLFGTDHAGNTWIMACLQSRTWQLIKEDLKHWSESTTK